MNALVDRARKNKQAKEALIESLFKARGERAAKLAQEYIQLETAILSKSLINCDGNEIYRTQGKLIALTELEDHFLGLSRPHKKG